MKSTFTKSLAALSLLLLVNQLGAGSQAFGQQGQPTQGQPTTQELPGWDQVAAADPIQPTWANLTVEHQEYIEMLLEKWQERSDQVKRFTCDFRRFDYDPLICNWRDPADNRLAAYSVVLGEIRFQNPGKASYEAVEAWIFDAPPKEAGKEPEYKKRDSELSQEKWVCDGTATYEFDFVNKRLYESEIPVEYQGAGLVDSPMPFLFGANKQQILDRYWVRVITPRGVEDEYWLEAVPKRKSDAQNYQRVHIVISRQDLLPNSIHVFLSNYDEKTNPVSRHFQFGNRRVNDQLSGITSFLGLFVRPQTPINWTRVDKNTVQSDAASANSQNNAIQQNLNTGTNRLK